MTRYNPKYSRPTDALTKKHLDKVEDRMIVRYDSLDRKRVDLLNRLRKLEERFYIVEQAIHDLIKSIDSRQAERLEDIRRQEAESILESMRNASIGEKSP